MRKRERIKAEGVEFSREGIRLLGEKGETELSYDSLLLSCVEYRQGDNWIRADIEEITEETEGRLLLGEARGKIYEITIEKAGTALIELTEHCPWLWVGGHECLDTQEEKAWKELRHMVQGMKACL